MKKLKVLIRPAIFLSITLLCAVFCQGQTTSTFKSGDSLTISSDVMSLSNGAPNEFKHDTISVVMLLTDTIHYTNYTPNLAENYFNKSGVITWVTGFAVRKITIEKSGSHQSGDMMWFNETDKYYYSTEKYLDSNMKLLSKYTIVWQVLSK